VTRGLGVNVVNAGGAVAVEVGEKDSAEEHNVQTMDVIEVEHASSVQFRRASPRDLTRAGVHFAPRVAPGASEYDVARALRGTTDLYGVGARKTPGLNRAFRSTDAEK